MRFLHGQKKKKERGLCSASLSNEKFSPPTASLLLTLLDSSPISTLQGLVSPACKMQGRAEMKWGYVAYAVPGTEEVLQTTCERGG